MNNYKLSYVSEGRITFSYMAVIDDCAIIREFVGIYWREDFLLALCDKHWSLTSKESRGEGAGTDNVRQNSSVIKLERN